jgi:hypothetical protein
VNNSRSRSTQTRQRIGTRSIEENKRSGSEELTQCDYSKIESVVINCEDFKCDYSKIETVVVNGNSAWYISNKPSIKSRTHKLLTCYQVTCHIIMHEENKTYTLDVSLQMANAQ